MLYCFYSFFFYYYLFIYLLYIAKLLTKINNTLKGPAWRTERFFRAPSPWSLLNLYSVSFMSQLKQKDRPSSLSSINSSLDEKRTGAEADETSKTSNMMEALDAKMDAIMKKLKKLDTIETQLKEVHTRMANFEGTISRLESEVKDLKKQKKKLEKKVEEFEECLQYNEDDISDIKRDNRKLENDVSELKKRLMYMETYTPDGKTLNSLACQKIAMH